MGTILIINEQIVVLFCVFDCYIFIKPKKKVLSARLSQCVVCLFDETVYKNVDLIRK